jgi:hypothetical protein
MNKTATAIFNKLTNLEQQVQKLKIQAYLNLPKNKQPTSLYSQAEINRVLRSTRKEIWRKRYAKKI